MLKRFAPLVPLTLAFMLGACSNLSVVSQDVAKSSAVAAQDKQKAAADNNDELTAEQLGSLSADKSYKLPDLADSVLGRGFELMGTPYRFGGQSVRTGFDCSGFVGYLFEEEAGIQLPHSTRELIKMDAPVVARNQLEPGDVLFFNNQGRGRVSHTGIYIGDDQFIHSSSRHSGGVRVDSLDERYWQMSYMEAKRVLAVAPGGANTPQQN
jgi:cell wall-associated NlpC family hydrolase